MKYKIIHNPCGKGNPYVPEPEERSPRAPSNRDVVFAGVVSEPADKNLKLSAVVTTNESERERVQAQWLEDKEGASHWRVPLPSGKAFDLMEYQFEVDEIAQSDTYRYTLDGFVVPGEYHRIGNKGSELYLYMKAGEKEIRRCLSFFDDKITINLDSSGSSPDDLLLEDIAQSDHLVSLEIGRYKVEVDSRTGILSISDKGKVLYRENGFPEFRIDGGNNPQTMKLNLEAGEDEMFFGFGERFNSFNQRGNVLDVRVYEEYKSQNEGNRTYLPIPFFLSSGGWGHCINSPMRISYDLRDKTAWSFEAELDGWALDSHLYFGSPMEIMRQQAELTGFPVQPPSWAFGPWMSSNEWNSQERVLFEINKSRKLDIPASVLVIEAWSDEKNFYIWNDAEYEVKEPGESFSYDDFTFPENGLWPDPKEMIEDIHSDDTKLILWQIPVSKHLEEGVTCRQNELDKQYMIDKGYCVRNEDGTPYTVKPWWFTHSLVIDFTSEEATKWWMDKRRYLIDELKVDGFKTDGGEHLWGRELRFADGRRGSQLWNEYPNHYINSYYKYINERNGGITFSRSGFMGVQNSPVHWAGDQDSTWDAHRSILKAVLNAGLSGVPFMGWDIGGFSGEIPTAELYLRSAAFACFGSIMQYHSEFYNHRTPHVDRTPWNIAERTGSPEVIDVYRYFAKLRMELIPYIEEEARFCCGNGSPLMRFMFIDFPEDPRCWQVEDQYMFGRDLLVCPMLHEGEMAREVYLPEGQWIDFFTGETVEGGQSITVNVPFHTIPVYRKANNLLDSISFPSEADL